MFTICILLLVIIIVLSVRWQQYCSPHFSAEAPCLGRGKTPPTQVELRERPGGPASGFTSSYVHFFATSAVLLFPLIVRHLLFLGLLAARFVTCRSFDAAFPKIPPVLCLGSFCRPGVLCHGAPPKVFDVVSVLINSQEGRAPGSRHSGTPSLQFLPWCIGTFFRVM